MRRNLSRFLRLQKESHRLSSSAKFNGTTILKKKQHGKEKMIFGKITLTYLLSNPNLEGEIHLKGVRFITSQIFIKPKHSPLHSYHHVMCALQKIFQTLKPSKNPSFKIPFICKGQACVFIFI